MKNSWRILFPVGILCVLLAGCGGDNSADLPDSGGGQKAAEYVPGERLDNEYSSEWSGLRYTLNDNMVMATDDELNAMMVQGADRLSDGSGKIEQMMDYAKLTIVFEMMAVDITNGSSIVIFTEKLALSKITEKQYLATVQQQIDSMYSSYAVTYSDVTERDLCGMAFTEMGYEVDYGDTSLFQTYLVRKQDARMYGMVLSGSDTSMLEPLLDGFSALQQ